MPEKRGPVFFECVMALAVAIFLVAGIDFFTNVMPPKWDTVEYMDMARSGIFGNDHLMAPFAYRPGMPLLARLVSDVAAIPLEDGFLWITRCSAIAFLFLCFLLSRCFTHSAVRAMGPVLLISLSAMHVKVPLFAPTAVDVAAYPLMVLAFLFFIRGRLWGCFWTACIGLFFKEFLAIPLFLALWRMILDHRKEPPGRNRLMLSLAILLALSVILTPRLFLHVAGTVQEIDPQHRPRSLGRLVLNPLNPLRNVNILLDLCSYWLPCLLLATSQRMREVREFLRPLEKFVIGFLALNLLLVMYGGTNILIFISYSAPIQIMILAIWAEKERHPVEWIIALMCMGLYNRVFSAIPLPDENFAAFIDFYEGWGSRVNLSTLKHFLEIAMYLGVMWGARSILRRHTKTVLPQE